MSENVVKLENDFNQVIERKIAVIFVTDVVGFSKSMEQNEDETLRSFRACKDILDKLFTEHGGRIFNTAGDSVLAVMAVGISSNQSSMISAAIASCVASISVEQMGNIPINLNMLRKKIVEIFDRVEL